MASTIRLHSGKKGDVALDPTELQNKLEKASPNTWVQLETPGDGTIYLRPDSVESFQEKNPSKSSYAF